MDLDELRRIRDQERSADGLQGLREEFYRDVAAYLDELRDQRNEAAAEAEDPFTDETVRRLSDELDTAQRTVEAIHERRVGKIVNLASFAAAEMSSDNEGLTIEEQRLFDQLVEAIESHRSAVFAHLEPGEETPDTQIDQSGEQAIPEDHQAPESTPQGGEGDENAIDRGMPADPAEDAQPENGTASPSPAEQDPSLGDPSEPSEADSGDIERTTVRITDDVGEIIGIDDRAYDLRNDDIVRLPRANADPLVDRDAAIRIEGPDDH